MSAMFIHYALSIQLVFSKEQWRKEGTKKGREGGKKKGRGWQEGGGKRNREEAEGGFVLLQKGSNNKLYLYLDHSFITENDVLRFMFSYYLHQFT